jgi:HSP20 family protein
MPATRSHGRFDVISLAQKQPPRLRRTQVLPCPAVEVASGRADCGSVLRALNKFRELVSEPFTGSEKEHTMTALLPRFTQALTPFFSRDPFAGIQQEMDELWSRFRLESNGDWQATAIAPSVDLSESDEAIQVRMDVPGLKASEIHVEVTGNILRISGEHKEEKKEKGRTYHRLERRVGTFSRAITLPAEVMEQKVSAECADGVLTINLPKSDAARTQTVKVIAK